MNRRLLTFGWPSRRPAARSAAGVRRPSARRAAASAVAVGGAVFVAIQAALSGASAVTLLVADPVYGDKERRLRWLERAAPAGTPRVILLGSSRTGFAFDAGRTQRAAADAGTPAVAFNFGITAAGPVTHRVVLRRLLAAGHRPDLLVLEVLPPLLADLPDGALEGRILKGDFLTRDEVEFLGRYGMPSDRLRREWAAAAAAPVYAHRFKLVGRVFPSALPWPCRYDWGRTPDPNGWNASNVAAVTDEERARGVAQADREYRAVLRYDLPAGPAAAALRDTLAVCRAEGIPVALVLLPEATEFRAMYPPEAEAKLAAFLAGLTAEFGCPVTDARGWAADGEFLDSHHLLRGGAERFTDRLTAEMILPFLRARAARPAP